MTSSDVDDNDDDDVSETTGFSVKPFGQPPTLDHLKGSYSTSRTLLGNDRKTMI